MGGSVGVERSSIQEAELIIRLYELRREAVMRQARSYVGGEFMPASVDEFVGLVSAGTKESGFVLQVYGYWDMVAAFVLHGTLNERLVYDTCQEMYFQYSKIQPFLPGFRERMNLPEFLQNLESVVEGSERGKNRVAVMRQNLARIVEVRMQARDGNL
jgi:hypothetical protein